MQSWHFDGNISDAAIVNSTNLLRTVGSDVRGSAWHDEAPEEGPIFFPLSPKYRIIARHHSKAPQQGEGKSKHFGNAGDNVPDTYYSTRVKVMNIFPYLCTVETLSW